MTNAEVMNCYEALKGISNSDVIFPVRFLFIRQKNMRILEPIASDFTTLKDELIKKYGTSDEDGQIRVETTNSEFMKEFNDLLEIENEVELAKVSIEDIPSEMPAKVYDMISFMVEE